MNLSASESTGVTAQNCFAEWGGSASDTETVEGDCTCHASCATYIHVYTICRPPVMSLTTLKMVAIVVDHMIAWGRLL